MEENTNEEVVEETETREERKQRLLQALEDAGLAGSMSSPSMDQVMDKLGELETYINTVAAPSYRIELSTISEVHEELVSLYAAFDKKFHLIVEDALRLCWDSGTDNPDQRPYQGVGLMKTYAVGDENDDEKTCWVSVSMLERDVVYTGDKHASEPQRYDSAVEAAQAAFDELEARLTFYADLNSVEDA